MDRRHCYAWAFMAVAAGVVTGHAEAQITAGRYAGSIRYGLGAPLSVEIVTNGTTGTATVSRNVDQIDQAFGFTIAAASHPNWDYDLVPTRIGKPSARGKSAGFTVRYDAEDRRLTGKSIGINNVDCMDLDARRQASDVAPPVVRVGKVDNLIPATIHAEADADGNGPVAESFYECLASAASARRELYRGLQAMKRRGQTVNAQAQTTLTVEASRSAAENACRMETGSRFNVRRALDAITKSGPPPGY